MTAFSPALHYQAYQALADLTTPMRTVARHLAPWLHHSLFWFPESKGLRKAAAACEVLALAGLTHARPPFGIDKVETENGTVAVSEEAVYATPFCTLQRFRKENAPEGPIWPRWIFIATGWPARWGGCRSRCSAWTKAPASRWPIIWGGRCN